jgi:hypothetical protein
MTDDDQREQRMTEIQAQFFFLDMIAQDVRGEVMGKGKEFWDGFNIHPEALVGVLEKYFPPAVLQNTLSSGTTITGLARQMGAMGFLLGVRWAEERGA